MAGRYTYSPYEVDQYHQYQHAMQSGPRRFFSAVGRFIYRLVVLTLVVGAIGGILFALYRNDVLLGIARGADLEAQYRSLEQRIGAPGWGTPRSIDVPAEAPLAANPATNAADDKQPETVQAVAKSEEKTSPDGLPIVSFDSLPTAPSKATNAAPETVSLSALPAAAPARATRAEPTRVSRAEPAPRTRAAKPVKTNLDAPAESSRSIPLPKPKPEPVAKAEPEPKPAPPPPKPEPEEDRTKARASDNPLKAAIRASMAGKKSGD